MRLKQLAWLGFLGLALPLALPAQDLPPLPQVARPQAGVILRPLELGFFFRRLKMLEEHRGEQPRRLNILEIGDSHLQGDLFSRPLRQALARRFGLAGRGLIFPYSVARTSNAFDLSSESNVSWVHRRSAVPPPQGYEDLDTGAAGFAILTHDPGYILHMQLRGDECLFDRVSIFSRRDANAYGLKISLHSDPDVLSDKNLVPHDRLITVVPGDSLYGLSRRHHVSVANLRQWNHIKGNDIFAGDKMVVRQDEPPAQAVQPVEGFQDLAVLHGGASARVSLTASLAQPGLDFFVRGFKDGATESEAVLYGAEVERAGADGLIYHTAGINGAELKHFATNPRFMQQARCLDPDLVIIALGTNEAMARDMKPGEIEGNMLNLIRGFTRNNSKFVAFLIITPPDVLDWGGAINPRITEVAERLRQFAALHDLALWDWQAVMGGPGSVSSWQEQHLVLEDGVHMTNAGYQVEAKLFFQAFMDAYDRN